MPTFYVSAAEVVYDSILVKINDSIITQYDLDEEMKPILAKIKGRELSETEKKQIEKLRRQTLDQMVNDALLAQEIVKFGIVVSDEKIDTEIKKVKEERKWSDEDFNEMLKKDGLTIEEFRKKLTDMFQKQELLGYMVHSKVLVTDTEIQKDYDDRREDYLLEKMVDLAIILLPPDISAIEVKKRIEDGEYTFSQAAAKYSVGPGKDQGGDIGEVTWTDLAEDWKEAIVGVEIGKVSTPLTVQGKEALLSPLKIVEDRLVPLEEVRDDIFNRLMQEKRETNFAEYFEKLKQSAVIIYMDGLDEPENGVSQ
jgi:peptidyl-prolyl cis-trans isomerase SurA